MILNDEEIPKHRKKKESSKSKSKAKADHKHNKVECLLVHEDKPYLCSYCSICGKVHNWMIVTEHIENYHRMLRPEEVYEKYNDLERIVVKDLFVRYIPVEIKRKEKNNE